ncbi:MAG: hypothetical protein ABFR31_13310, partial [Thermodesulfobacteriota bacterium]
PEPFVWRAEALLGIAQYESSIGNHDSALQYILQALEEKGNREINLYAASILEKMEEEDLTIRRKHLKMAINFYKKAYSQKKSAFILYQIATLLRSVDENQEAENFFLKVIKKYPNSKYAVYSKKSLERKSKFLPGDAS